MTNRQHSQPIPNLLVVGLTPIYACPSACSTWWPTSINIYKFFTSLSLVCDSLEVVGEVVLDTCRDIVRESDMQLVRVQ